MRKTLQGIIITSLMAFGLNAVSSINAFAQKDKYWGHQDFPYVEQRGWSLGMNIGLADMWGDVGTKSVIDRYNNKEVKDDLFANIRGMGGLYARYNHIPGLAFRIGINYGEVYATDAWNYDKAMDAEYVTEDPYQRYLRNLDAKTTIWELNAMVELSPIRAFGDWEFGKGPKRRFQPYVMLGISGFYFNPRGKFTDLVTKQEKWVDLRPLRTEGEGFVGSATTYPKTYSVFSFAALGGVGVKWDIGQGLALGLEWQLRYTFTDYLDDVSGVYANQIDRDIAYLDRPNRTSELSTRMADKSREIIPGYTNPAGAFRGNPDNNDMFSTLQVTLMWKVKWREIGWWSARR